MLGLAEAESLSLKKQRSDIVICKTFLLVSHAETKKAASLLDRAVPRKIEALGLGLDFTRNSSIQDSWARVQPEAILRRPPSP